MMICIFLVLFITKCLGMEEEGQARVSNTRQRPGMDIRMINLEGGVRGMYSFYPFHSVGEFPSAVNMSTGQVPSVANNMEIEWFRSVNPNAHGPIPIVNPHLSMLIPPQSFYEGIYHSSNNLRQQSSESSRLSRRVNLDLDTYSVPWGLGMKSYGERIFIFTIKNTMVFRMSHIKFGDKNLEIPLGSRTCVAWVFNEGGLYHVILEVLNGGKWISREFIENGPGSNRFKQISLQVNSVNNPELNTPIRNENVQPYDIVLSTDLNINDPNWLRTIPQGVITVDMPGNPYKYFEIGGSLVRIGSIKFGNIFINIGGNHRKLIWSYHANSLKHVRIEIYSPTIWHGEVWVEESAGSNNFKIADRWAFSI